MQKKLFFKILIVLFLALLLAVPLGMVNNLVTERMERQNSVVADIAASYAESQRITGPVLVLPYVEEYSEQVTTPAKDGEAEITKTVRKRIQSAIYLPPKDVKVGGKISTEVKRRGLFSTPVYLLDSQWDGSFEIPANIEPPRHGNEAKFSWGQPFISLPVKDTRGLVAMPDMKVDGKKLTFTQGSDIAFLSKGVHAGLPEVTPGAERKLPFSLGLKLRGTETLAVVPMADNLHVDLASNWPHPSFGGRFLPLPDSEQISSSGFKASWEISSVATDVPARFDEATLRPLSCPDGNCLEQFEVRMVEPVNIYVQSDRAVKYGFLFIGLTFAAFFLFEILKGLAIHPAQYTLVGLAQAVFFLLLLSLSEHIDFSVAYAASAAACVLLVGYYLGYVMRGIWRGAGFAALLGALYAALYGLLVSEDNALLMGSLLLFGLIAAAMVVTRKFDWYRLTPANTAPKATTEA